MKVQPIQVPINPQTDYDRAFRQVFALWAGKVTRSSNSLSAGEISGADLPARISAPTDGAWAYGDRLTNSAPQELGPVGSKYTIDGWTCVASGSPGAWVERRLLTGN